MKRWLIVETALVTMVPACLAIYALPVLVFASIEVFVPVATDTRSLVERMLGLTPYVGGILALLSIWRMAVAMAVGRKFSLDWWFWLGLLGGALATKEIVVTTNTLTGILVCLPVWLLVMQLTALRYRWATVSNH